MKKLFNILALFAIMILLAMPVIGQTTTDNLKVIERQNGLVLRWDDLAVDSAGTVWSQIIDLSNYDNYTWTSDGVYIGGKAATASGNPKLLLDYYVCNADPTVNANWILGNDSLMTCNATTVFNASTLRFTSKAGYVKFKLANLATGVAVTALDLGIYFIKRDEN